MATLPQILVIAGPNGAGKSTSAAFILPREIPFVNADEIAKVLPGYPSPSVDIHAARIVIETMKHHEVAARDFALETTLSSRSLALRLRRLRRKGYRVRLCFLFLSDPEIAVERVARRVRLGGHDIPEETIRRRFAAGLRNFFELYQPLADRWSVYDTREAARPRVIASGRRSRIDRVADSSLWDRMKKESGHV